MLRITRRRLITFLTGLIVVLLLVGLASRALTKIAETELRPGGGKEQVEQDVKTHAEAITGVRVILVRCGGITATERECFVTFANKQKAVALVTWHRGGTGAKIDSFRMGGPPTRRSRRPTAEKR